MELWWIVVFVIGTFIGSFLNVCIYRLPRGRSIVTPRSQCPQCSKPIAWYDNVPLLSYLALGRKCRHCHRAIHWRYPVVEILSGVAAVAVLRHVGLNASGSIYLAFIWALIVVSFIDLEFQIIPDEISLGGLVIGVLLSLLVPQLHGSAHSWVALKRSLIGAVVGGGLLYVTGAGGNVMLKGLRLLGIRLRHRPFWRRALARYRHMKEAMGGGDVKLMAMAGSLLGWKLVTIAFFLAPLVAIVPGLMVLLIRQSSVIPYGPFLSLALVLSLFAGSWLLQVTAIEDTIQLLMHYPLWG